MRIDTQRCSSENASKTFSSGRRPESVEHFLDAGTQRAYGKCARSQIVKEKMRDFMCQREKLFIEWLCTIKKYDADTSARNEVPVEGTIGSIVTVSDAAPI